jgi:hypothetical protein
MHVNIYVPNEAFSWIRLPIVDKINLHKMVQRLTKYFCRKLLLRTILELPEEWQRQTTGAGRLQLLVHISVLHGR